MSDLENRMIKGFKDNIAISKLREECIMKKQAVKKVITFSLLGVLCVFGSFFTVNAATGGELLDNITTVIYRVYDAKTGKEIIADSAYTVNVHIDTDSFKTNESGENATIYYYEQNEDGSFDMKTTTATTGIIEMEDLDIID